MPDAGGQPLFFFFDIHTFTGMVRLQLKLYLYKNLSFLKLNAFLNVFFVDSESKEKITFCRRNKGIGIYTGNVKVKGRDQVIRLADRELITPTEPDIIKFLYDDPEIEVYCADEKEQKEEDGRNKEKGK